MAGRRAEPRPGTHHVVWGQLEVDASGEWSSANNSWSSALKGVQINEESSSSLQYQDVESHGPLSSGTRAITPQALGDQGLSINSDGEAEEDELAIGSSSGQGPCYNYELHNSGRCKPCNFFAKKVGCTGGDSCTFCHLPHTEQKRARPSKVKRDRCKVIAESTPAPAGQRPPAAGPSGEGCGGQRLEEMAGRESLQGSYMRSILASRAKKEDASSVVDSVDRRSTESSGGGRGG